MYLSGWVCFSMIMGSVCLRRDRAAPNSLSSISSRTTCSGEQAKKWNSQVWTLIFPHSCFLRDLLHARTPHLLIEVYQGFIWQLEGLDRLQDCVPVAAVNVRNEALDTVHSIQRDGGLLLQGGQSPLQIVLLQILHDQTNHAVENE